MSARAVLRWMLGATLSLAAGTLVITAAEVPSGAAPRATAPHSWSETLSLPRPFVPVPPKRGTDLYHCALLNPHVSVGQMITSTTFTPGTPFEVHHAILYWVPPSQAAAATKMNAGGKGWTCFGGPGIGGTGTIADLGSSSWLSGWAPGHGTDTEPTGTAMPLPAGSLIVMQIHYNMLTGHAPDLSTVKLQMVPAAGSSLLPLQVDLYPAPMDLPCPAKVTGALCNRAASLRDIGRRFGASAIRFDDLLEVVCHRGRPQVSDTATCTWPIESTAYIWDITAHMHLLGVSFKVTLNPSTARQRVLLDVPSYDFHYQRSYNMAAPVKVVQGDRLAVQCTYNAALRGELPFLRSLPARMVLWADGSSDEMCLAILGVTRSLSVHAAAASLRSGPGTPQWPAALAGAFASRAGSTSALREAQLGVAQVLGDADEFLSRVGLCGVSY